MSKIGGSLGLLTGMRLITGLELLFWFLAMITRICFKFEGKEKQKNKITSTVNESAAVPYQTKLRRDYKLKNTGGAQKAYDTAKKNRIDEMEDTIRKINLKLEMIENDLCKGNEFQLI